ncbi:MAG: hypothetical protein CL678_10530 [Bdellovibrionaceae bacterium]|nr:hypothetical protein [Pseudobdellovibrionaceae bacterium]
MLLDHHQLYSSELGPQVQTLLTLKDWNATAKKIATVLNSSISEIENLLHILKNLDLATVQNGIWTAKTPEFHTKDSLGDLTLQTFHKKSLLTAIRHLDSPPKNRRYFAVHLTLDDQQMEELATEMKKTCFEYLSKFGTDSSKNKRLYQINLNLIPVSPQLSTEKPKSVPVGGASSLKQGEKHD